MKFDFIQTVDAIFKNKKLYKEMSDIDKDNNFFIINRKFGTKFIKHAQFFNSRYMDKATALDMWNLFFRKQEGIPSWYWGSSSKKKEKEEKEKNKKLPAKDRELLLRFNSELKDSDIDFLLKYYQEDVFEEVKKLRKFDIDE